MMDMTKKMENDSDVYKTLLESTKAIPWKLDWNTMRFAYIGPQIENLLGWSPSSWVSVENWAERIHAEDRDEVVNFCVAQSQAGIDHEADYRALTKDGDYVWIRDVVHVVRNEEGRVDSLVGFMFDISERKKTEEKLLSLQKELEDLSFKDGLTGVANRRMFDSIMEVEWGNAKRNNQPLSLIMLDIDYFKQYNDQYGHIQGDECLKRVGKTLNSAGTRPRDFFARFGGEEFVLVLPETDEKSAKLVAERCRSLIFKEQIPHEKSQVSQILTVSLGVGTIIPSHSGKPIEFIEEVDKQLYKAKQKGRNCMVCSHSFSKSKTMRGF
jgi:diguanylate cyclase (GGDEF)-like protein/PAS domain S-box-containing protein